jgi:hypothetical protein
LIEHGTLEEKKQFIRSSVASIEVDGKNRKIRVGCFDPGEDVALRLMPPTGQRAEGRNFTPSFRTRFGISRLRVLK